MWSTPPIPFGTQNGITAMMRAVSPSAHGPASNARSHGCRRPGSAVLELAAANSRPSPQKLNVVDSRYVRGAASVITPL